MWFYLRNVTTKVMLLFYSICLYNILREGTRKFYSHASKPLFASFWYEYVSVTFFKLLKFRQNLAVEELVLKNIENEKTTFLSAALASI